MTTIVNVHEAKTQLSKLLEAIERGDEVVIARAGKPVARLAPIRRREPRRLGALKGRLSVPDDFDTSLPSDVLRSFHVPL